MVTGYRERRQYPRVPCNVETTGASGWDWIRGRVVNVSCAGVLLQLNKPIEVGATLSLGNQERSTVRGEVVWALPDADGFQVGLVFSQPRDVRSWLQEAEELVPQVVTDIKLPALLEVAGRPPVDAEIRSLGQGGALLSTSRLVPSGSMIRINTWPGHGPRPPYLAGRVVNCEERSADHCVSTIVFDRSTRDEYYLGSLLRELAFVPRIG